MTLSADQVLTSIVAIVSIVATGSIAYCSQSSVHHAEMVSTEWVNARRLEATTLDSVYVRLGQELRAISDRRNAMVGRYSDLPLKSLNQRIDATNRIDDAWRDAEGLWDVRVRLYLQPAVIAVWDRTLPAVHRYGKCVENVYHEWIAAKFVYRPDSSCSADSVSAKSWVDRFRDSAVYSFRTAKPVSK